MHLYWKKFRKDKYFLTYYFFISLIVMTLLVSTVFAIRFSTNTANMLWNIEFDFRHLFLIPLALILGVRIPSIMHNCVHGNIKPKILNLIIGELSGLYTLLGMAAFEVNHKMHHIYSDTELDPHNPEGKKFRYFFFANNFGGTKPVLTKYLQMHGDSLFNRSLFHSAVFFHFSNALIRLALWYVLLGPSLFILFFVPSYLFHMFVFAHINYYSHDGSEKEKNHETRIYNLNHNIYYRFVNFFGNGVYFHENHHKNPNHYNPQLRSGPSWIY